MGLHEIRYELCLGGPGWALADELGDMKPTL